MSDRATHIAFLRALNMGKVNSIPKQALVAAFESAGAEAVTTHLASGNILFSAAKRQANTLLANVGRTLAKNHAYSEPIGAWTVDQISALAEHVQAAPAAGVDYLGVFVSFLFSNGQPPAALPISSTRGDARLYHVSDYAALSHRWRIGGRSGDVNAFIESKLGVAATTRAWRTIEGILAKARSFRRPT